MKVRAGADLKRPGQARRARILFVINSLAGGGAERVMATILANSREWLGTHEFALALLDSDSHAFALPPWLKLIELDCKGNLVASLRATDRLVGSFDPDLTVSFLTRANIATGLAMMRRRRPWIISERTSIPAHLGSAFRRSVTRLLMRWLYPRASRVIAVSSGVAARLTSAFGVQAPAIEIIPNPVDSGALEAASAEPDSLAFDGPYVIAIGRFVGVKNYRLLIEAFAAAPLGWSLVLAGDGPEREALGRTARAHGVADRVIFPGWLSNPYPALRKAAAFALSSDVEGFPNALVEALALGVPAVATDCSDGPAEILAGTRAGMVTDAVVARAGILAPVGDRAAYARALALLLDAPLRARLAQAGRVRARDFAAPAIVARYWEVIEGALLRAAERRAT